MISGILISQRQWICRSDYFLSNLPSIPVSQILGYLEVFKQSNLVWDTEVLLYTLVLNQLTILIVLKIRDSISKSQIVQILAIKVF